MQGAHAWQFHGFDIWHRGHFAEFGAWRYRETAKAAQALSLRPDRAGLVSVVEVRWGLDRTRYVQVIGFLRGQIVLGTPQMQLFTRLLLGGCQPAAAKAGVRPVIIFVDTENRL